MHVTALSFTLRRRDYIRKDASLCRHSEDLKHRAAYELASAPSPLKSSDGRPYQMLLPRYKTLEEEVFNCAAGDV